MLRCGVLRCERIRRLWVSGFVRQVGLCAIDQQTLMSVIFCLPRRSWIWGLFFVVRTCLVVVFLIVSDAKVLKAIGEDAVPDNVANAVVAVPSQSIAARASQVRG